jgi:hypothetical protein
MEEFDSPLDLSGWRLWVARIGLVASFLYFLTIPGWFALAGWRRWRRGEATKPTAALFWGYWFLGSLAVASVVIIVLEATGGPY